MQHMPAAASVPLPPPPSPPLPLLPRPCPACLVRDSRGPLISLPPPYCQAEELSKALRGADEDKKLLAQQLAQQQVAMRAQRAKAAKAQSALEQQVAQVREGGRVGKADVCPQAPAEACMLCCEVVMVCSGDKQRM